MLATVDFLLCSCVETSYVHFGRENLFAYAARKAFSKLANALHHSLACNRGRLISRAL
jgi:hypothetical protein